MPLNIQKHSTKARRLEQRIDPMEVVPPRMADHSATFNRQELALNRASARAGPSHGREGTRPQRFGVVVRLVRGLADDIVVEKLVRTVGHDLVDRVGIRSNMAVGSADAGWRRAGRRRPGHPTTPARVPDADLSGMQPKLLP